jgi:hypothetical protein
VCVLFNIGEDRFLVSVEIRKPIKSRHSTTPQSIIKRACSWWLIIIIWKWWCSISCKIIDIIILIDKLFIFILQIVINLVSLLSFAWDQIYIREVNHAFLNCAHISLTGDDCVGRFVILRWIKTSEAPKRVMLVRNISLGKYF